MAYDEFDQALERQRITASRRFQEKLMEREIQNAERNRELIKKITKDKLIDAYIGTLELPECP